MDLAIKHNAGAPPPRTSRVTKSEGHQMLISSASASADDRLWPVQ